jgi:hypothetical protein
MNLSENPFTSEDTTSSRNVAAMPRKNLRGLSTLAEVSSEHARPVRRKNARSKTEFCERKRNVPPGKQRRRQQETRRRRLSSNSSRPFGRRRDKRHWRWLLYKSEEPRKLPNDEQKKRQRPAARSVELLWNALAPLQLLLIDGHLFHSLA